MIANSIINTILQNIIITIDNINPIQNRILYHFEFSILSGMDIIKPLILEFLISIIAPIKHARNIGNIYIGKNIKGNNGNIFVRNAKIKNIGIRTISRASI